MSDRLKPQQHAQILEQIISDKLDKVQPVKKPRCFLLGGQPGAGKGRVRKAIEESPAGAGSLVIDPDELRTYHPRYAEHVATDADTAANKVHQDAMQWATELRAAAIAKKVNLIIDGTLGNTSAAPGLATEAADGGYQVEVHVIATSIEVSKQSVRSRFEQAFEACRNSDDAELPRNVPESVQLGAYQSIPDSLRLLAATGKVSRMRVANRDGESLSDLATIKAVQKDGAKSANTSLQKERDRPWTEEEIKQYAETADRIESLMLKRIKANDGDAKARDKLTIELEKQRSSMSQVIKEKNSSKVTDDDMVILRLSNTGRTVKKDNWIMKVLRPLFTKKKKQPKAEF